MKKLPEENAMQRICILIVAAVFAWFGLCAAPNTFAVVPAPDGGYSGGNTAEGQNALLGLTDGLYNTGTGLFSLLSLTSGSLNTADGAGTLLSNIADQNTATGAGALLNNSTGEDNTANGAFALFSNTTAGGNTAIGSNALLNNTTGGTLGITNNFAVGPNVAIGQQALENNTIASGNTAVGYQALNSNTTGLNNTDLGISTAVGFQSLAHASGPDAGANDGFGYQTLFNLTSGGSDVAIGANALLNLTSGDANTAVGAGAGSNLTSGDFNVFIGQGAGSNVTNASNVICIGADAAGNNAGLSCFIANIFGQTSAGGVGVFINSNGRLGTSTSSRRFKEDIKPMGRASEAILALKPVTFHYKRELDADRIPQFGLVAEDVEKVNPDLIVRDKDGKPYSVRYEQVNAMLLNEFLKEHREVEELKAAAVRRDATVADLQSTVVKQEKGFQLKLAKQEKQIEALTLGLEKVSAKIEISGHAPEVVINR
ncbi:MAG: tail fiber domain-containing protein [Candidatus Udaeobacter sp.]